MTNYVHQGDLPDDVTFDGDIAVDTEAMGLDHTRDRLCVVQVSDGKGDAHLVQFYKDQGYDAPNLKRLLGDPDRVKIMHYARFDLGIIKYYMDLWAEPVFCTKIASKLVRTYTEAHGLKVLAYELLKVNLHKQQQCSDWGNEILTEEQIKYAAEDVLYLHDLRHALVLMLERESRMELAGACFSFLHHRVELDLNGWIEKDIFAHS